MLIEHRADHPDTVPEEVWGLWEYATRFGASYILLDCDADRVDASSPATCFRWKKRPQCDPGTQDDLLDEHRDRVVDVFPTVEALQAASYHDQSASDLLAVDGPAPVGIPANRIPHLLKLQGQRTFAAGSTRQTPPEHTVASSDRAGRGQLRQHQTGTQHTLRKASTHCFSTAVNPIERLT